MHNEQMVLSVTLLAKQTCLLPTAGNNSFDPDLQKHLLDRLYRGTNHARSSERQRGRIDFCGWWLVAPCCSTAQHRLLNEKQTRPGTSTSCHKQLNKICLFLFATRSTVVPRDILMLCGWQQEAVFGN
jgi:hypothetical protein